MPASGTPRRNAASEADVQLRVRGLVQGVGFRPFVHRAARRRGLRGWVLNDGEGVLIRAVGSGAAVADLAAALAAEAPSAARVDSVISEALAAGAEPPGPGFAILASAPNGRVETAIPPDLAVCPDCRRELLDPGDRRHLYPFINCTQCGPRYSILESLPYDRPRTTMRAFRMCPRCAAEYGDPADRRFHAEPNACPECGPQARFIPAAPGLPTGPDPIASAAAALAAGWIVALKGLGGFHLLVDAANGGAIARLRRRKHREEKPFAVLFPDLASVAACAEVSPESGRLLASPAAPIVLLRRRAEAPLAAEIAPGNPWVGAMLPSSPLQILLLGALGRPVVATSGNLSGEPLCFGGAEAARRLAGIADAFLDHNREIVHPVDDSVVRPAAGGSIVLRRARGLAPATLRLPASADGCWLSVGAQMKAAVGVACADRLTLSPHIGDLDHPASRSAFEGAARTLRGLHGREFDRVICDLHPDYASTRFAEATGLPRTAVQHHLAHVLACLLEYGRDPEGILGIAWDGTGYGEDGTIWGGEFLLLGGGQALRFARLRPFRLPGGEAAIRDGRRSALGLVHEVAPAQVAEAATMLGFGGADAAGLAQMLSRGLNSPLTSSIGRLFDAVAALLGIGGRNHFEGQAGLAVEAAASHAEGDDAFSFPLRPVAPGGTARFELDLAPLLDAITPDDRWRLPPARAALALHRGLAHAATEVAFAAGVRTVALGGGCFQNALLLELTTEALRRNGFEVLIPRQLPPNDGCIAAGQALGALLGLTSVSLP
ncbi:MAG TPA: carbamoyltransferase HypF [Opitutaceae bacterium]|nr:carbamoyltransferase HypF [Opitutaceae bacterium]